jgi:23S rRNA pseudouridine1911/1915/1917 synthase
VRVDAEDHGRGALDLLASRWTHSPREVWAERLAAGELSVADAPLTADRPLRRGEVLRWRRPPWEEPQVPLHFELLHEDDDVVAVAKPSGLPTMPAGGFLDHTLLALVAARWPDAAPMHRLGRGTSGVVLFGRRPAARAAIQAAWRARAVEKVYRALVTGHPDDAVIQAAIGPVEHPTLGTLNAASPAGRDAVSRLTVIRREADRSVVEVRIDTGRPHQIRIHAAFLGHPLVGDPLYGPGGVPRADALPGDLGYTLHAWRLTLAHPATGAPLTLTAPLPERLR